MSDIETSIIMPTHNRKHILKKSLKALNQQTYSAANYEIIVIDDGSTDGTGNMVKNLDLKPELIYKYQSQSGPAAARNHGIKIAGGQFIIFIDDDIIVTPDFAKSHIQEQKKQKNIIVHGPVIYTNNPEHPTDADKKLGDYSSAYFATGNVSIRKQYLLEVGLFNEDFREYGWEDLEMGQRLQQLNLKKIKTEDARGYHLKHEFSPAQIPELLKREEARGRTAVSFYNINPSWSVRMMTLYWRPFFILKKILTAFHWPQWQITRKAVTYFHKKGFTKTRNFLFYFMKLEAYFRGLKQGSNQQF